MHTVHQSLTRFSLCNFFLVFFCWSMLNAIHLMFVDVELNRSTAGSASVAVMIFRLNTLACVSSSQRCSHILLKNQNL